MIDFKKYSAVFGFNSLYLGLFVTIAIGLVCSLFTYGGTKKLARETINDYYNTEENRLEREEAYFNSLQSFCHTNGISGEDTERIAEWTNDNRYVYLLLYKDDEVYFSSEIDNDEDFMGGIVSFPSRDELVAAAEKNDMYELVLTDCSLFANVAEFTDYLYLDLSHLLSLMAAVLIFGICLIIYVSRIISRIKNNVIHFHFCPFFNFHHLILRYPNLLFL